MKKRLSCRRESRNMQNGQWTHNTAYHKWILRRARGKASALDVGCGDGLLVQRLAAVCGSVTGIDAHSASIQRARARLGACGGARVIEGDFLQHDFGVEAFDLVVFAASLHHMDEAAALEKAKALLAPGGLLLVVGCARPESVLDWGIELLRVIPARLGSALHGERNGGNTGAPVAEPQLSLRDIRSLCRRILPGTKLRLGLYYRYLLIWKKPVIAGPKR